MQHGAGLYLAPMIVDQGTRRRGGGVGGGGKGQEALVCTVSQKIPPEDLRQFFQNGWEFFNQILRAYYAFLSTLDYKFVFNYPQL